MKNLNRIIWFLGFVFILFSCQQIPEEYAAADKFRLSWTDDPTTTMTIIWDQKVGAEATIFYGKEDFGRQFWKYDHQQKPTEKLLNYYHMNTFYCTLENLQPDAIYFFLLKDSVGVSKRFSFRTAPDKPQQFTFVTGGDTKSSGASLEAGRASNKMVAKLRPLFVLFNGDFNSGNGTYPDRWHQWLNDWESLATTADGRLFPVIAVHGNHENGNKSILNKIFGAPFQGTDSTNIYYSLSIGGDFFHMISLNTEIDEGGAQRDWLQHDLQAHADFTFKIAGYHKPFWPHTAKKGENEYQYEQWAGLFYKYGLNMSFDGDSHMHKITYPLRPSRENGSYLGFIRDDENGTMFVGEGSWGAHPRPNDDDKPWTMQSESVNQIKWIHVKPAEPGSPASMEIFTVITSRYDAEQNQTFYVDDVESISDGNRFEIPQNITLFTGKDSVKSVKYPLHLNE